MLSSRLLFEAAGYAVAGVSFHYGWDAKDKEGGAFFRGVQAFALTSIFDKALKFLFLDESVKAERISISSAILSGLFEEALYSGLLNCRYKIASIPRFAFTLFSAMSAARTFTGRVTPEQSLTGFTSDTLIGLIWAAFRELIFSNESSSSFLSTFLDIADGIHFALVEVSPKREGEQLALFSDPWLYKVITSLFFRCTANKDARTHGMTAPFVQHVLFNLACALETRH